MSSPWDCNPPTRDVHQKKSNKDQQNQIRIKNTSKFENIERNQRKTGPPSRRTGGSKKTKILAERKEARKQGRKEASKEEEQVIKTEKQEGREGGKEGRKEGSHESRKGGEQVKQEGRNERRLVTLICRNSRHGYEVGLNRASGDF